MRSVVRGGALLLAVTCVVWTAVVWHSRAAQHDLDDADVVLYLCALPIVVSAILLAFRWAFRKALARVDGQALAAHTVAASSSSALAPTSVPADAAAVPAPWLLRSAWVHTAAASSVEDLLAAALAGEPRPSPDDELLDEDGMPVMTARIDRLRTDDVETAMQRHAEALLGPLDGPTIVAVPGRAVRALAILAPLVDEAAQTLLGLSEQWPGAVDSVAGDVNGSSTRQSASLQQSGHDKVIRVLVAWPLDWDDATCAAAKLWLSDRLCAPLGDAVPRSGWSVGAQRLNGNELLLAAQRTLDDLRLEGRDDPLVLMACHSDLDDEGIARLAADQRLFHPTRSPKVAMAGEGAAVLVAFALKSPVSTADGADPIRLAGLTLAQRTESIEAPGRTSPAQTIGLAHQSLQSAGLASDTIAKLASDADQHTARTTELFGVTLAVMPALDANEDLCLVGGVTGRLGAAAPLVCLACAAAQARESARPTIALSLADSHWRMAAVLTPESFALAVAA